VGLKVDLYGSPTRFVREMSTVIEIGKNLTLGLLLAIFIQPTACLSEKSPAKIGSGGNFPSTGVHMISTEHPQSQLGNNFRNPRSYRLLFAKVEESPSRPKEPGTA
jgi:hypothetical protein